MIVKIKRIEYDDKQTLGILSFGDFECKTLELPWKNNDRRVSCIPRGIYHVEKRVSAKYGNHFWIKDVENRSFILIHSGNYYMNTLGCILVGTDHTDINGDGHRDVISSKDTMIELNKALPQTFILDIL